MKASGITGVGKIAMRAAHSAIFGLGLLLGGSGPSLAQPAPTANEARIVRIEIASQPLSAALNQWAEQTGYMVLIAIDSRVKEGISPRIVGDHTPEAALRLLLVDSGLSYERVGPRTVSIRLIEKRTSVSPGPAAERTVRSHSEAIQQVEEVIVSSRKRDERILDVPIAVSLFNHRVLEAARIENVTDMYGRVPGLFVSQDNLEGPTRDYTHLTMRGVGATPALEPAVAVFVDGVYQGSLGYDISFLDVERVEILRGPQGTLFGRNTQGGAVNIITRRPDRNFSAQALLNYGSFDAARAGGSVRGALAGNTLFASAAVQASQTHGFARNTTLNRGQNASDKAVARLALRWVPTAQTDMQLSFDGSRFRGGELGNGIPEGRRAYETIQSDYRDQRADIFGGSLRIDYAARHYRLTSLTGFRAVRSESYYDFDGREFVGNFQSQDADQRHYSQELRFASPESTGRLSWLGGLYAFRETKDNTRILLLPDLSAATAENQRLQGFDLTEIVGFERTGYALFGQAIFQITRRLSATIGLRQSWEETGIDVDRMLELPVIDTTIPFVKDATKSFSGFVPMASVTWHWARDVMTYATISRGFKAGGFQRHPNSAAALSPVDNEETTNYEIGTKSSLLDGRVTLHGAVYHVEITDQQLNSLVTGADGMPSQFTDNAGSSHTQGFELEITTRPAQGWELSGAVGYTDAQYDRYIDSAGVNRANDSFPAVPKWMASAEASYRTALRGSCLLVLRSGYHYVNEFFVGNDLSEDPILAIKRYQTLDVSAGIEGARWTISVYVDNALDDFIVANRKQAVFFPEAPAFQFQQVLPPRQTGVSVSYRW